MLPANGQYIFRAPVIQHSATICRCRTEIAVNKYSYNESPLDLLLGRQSIADFVPEDWAARVGYFIYGRRSSSLIFALLSG